MLGYIIGGIVLGAAFTFLVLSFYKSGQQAVAIGLGALAVLAGLLFIGHSGSHGEGYAVAAVVEMAVGSLVAYGIMRQES